MADKNLAQEVVDDVITDPDADADGPTPPAPPQTIEAEPSDPPSR